MSNGTSSHLFTIRIWTEEISKTESELRGKVLHVSTGETRYFRDWSKLLAFIQDMMSRAGAIRGASGTVEEECTAIRSHTSDESHERQG